jgi:hypothetical protein
MGVSDARSARSDRAELGQSWIIEDNVIHDAKASAISIGKEFSTGHNYAMLRLDKPGYQYQLESVFSARQIGWDREHIGSHIVRRNTASTTARWEPGWTSRRKAPACRGTSSITTSATSSWRDPPQANWNTSGKARTTVQAQTAYTIM